MKVLIIGTYPGSLSNFRGDLIKDLIAYNHSVVAISEKPSNSTKEKIREYGASHLTVEFSRTNINILNEIKSLISLVRIFLKEKPDAVLAYTIKPVIFSGIACLFFSKIRFIPLITGLGYAFGDGGFKRKLFQILALFLYKLAFIKAHKVVFQNKDNKNKFITKGLVKEEKATVVNGSGVNLNTFKFQEYTNTTPSITFLMIARLLIDKGIKEYLISAQHVKRLYPDVSFIHIGGKENSPNKIDDNFIETYKKLGIVSFKGKIEDVKQDISESSVFVLPSHHEGMSRSIQEAMAIGRPILTTNIPGCREAIENGSNGFIVEKGNINDLTEKMIWFIKNYKIIAMMGNKSRKRAEDLFDVRKINRKMIDILTK